MWQTLRFGRGFFLVLAALLFTAQARADNFVVAYSSAAPGYMESRKKDGQIQPQTYVFMQGQFFPGTTRDSSLVRLPFATLANRLAGDLKSQQFFPARSLSEADLLIVVHWGVMTGKERDYDAELRRADRMNDFTMRYGEALRNETDDNPETNNPSYISSLGLRMTEDFEVVRSASIEVQNDISGDSAATMLGFSGDLRREQAKLMSSELQKTLVSLLEVDRYFIVVIAYDRRLLTEERVLKRQWCCRLSIRSPGVNFPIALDRMGEIGANYFGTEQVELKMQPAKRKRRPEVTIGEAIILEYQTDKEPPKPVEK